MLVLDLLKYAATDSPSAPANQVISPLDEVDDRQIRWVIDAGLGPLLYRAMRDRTGRVPGAWRDALLSAELTAQVWSGNLRGTATEVIAACKEARAPVTLLKGVSTSDQYYPSAHLRPMADIDVLIPEHTYESVESSILRRGYNRHLEYEPAEDPHHGIPLSHPERRVWVELHTALFPIADSLRFNAVFSPSHIAAQSVASTFHGSPVYRLSDELQLVYIASSWMRDLTLSKIHPSFLISLLDAVYLLKCSGRTLDWNGLLGWVDNVMAIASLYVMLAYLSRHGFEPCSASVLSRLASGQDIVGPLQLRVIHAMLDHYLIGGRPWNYVFPPPVPGRYSVQHQLRKRWPARLFMAP